MQFARLLLLPFSLLYGIAVWLRNIFYDNGILRSVSFPLPIISTGNLTTGGTGKTPHTEYLVQLLKDKNKVATLSRGYGRSTKGFFIASNSDSSTTIGDEPLQYFSKFEDIIVSVGEKRKPAIENLLKSIPKPEVILLDDAYQHRKVKAGISILLIEYDSIFKDNYLLPAGSLRESKIGMKRADIIIVSKSPDILVPIERKRVSENIRVMKHQQLFFSFYKYGEFIRVTGKEQNMMSVGAKYYFEKRFTILLVTGIANPQGLKDYMRRQTDKLETLAFPDHHSYSLKDIQKIKDAFDNIASTNKIIVTTEKDAMRLKNSELAEAIKQMPVFYVPIEVAFHHNDAEKFNKQILEYVRKNKAHVLVH